MADFLISGTVTLVSGLTHDGKAGAPISQGDWLYRDLSDATFKPASKLTATESSVAGVALHDSLAGQPIQIAAKNAIVELGSNALSVGEVYALSDAGAMAPIGDISSADFVSLCCFAIEPNFDIETNIESNRAIVLGGGGVQRP